jgi:hypothetical protein
LAASHRDAFSGRAGCSFWKAGMVVKLASFIAGVFGTVGFALSILAGVTAGNTMESVLGRGVLCALVCYVVGYLVGLVAQQVAVEHAQHVTELVAADDAQKAVEEREEQAQRDAVAEAANIRLAEAVAGVSPAAASPAKGKN